jgi:hypothetical protein
MIYKRGERSVDCDENGWPKMTMKRRELWFGPFKRESSDEALVRIMLDPKLDKSRRHARAPWAFKVDGDVYEEYEYIVALAKSRGYGSFTRIGHVENGGKGGVVSDGTTRTRTQSTESELGIIP